MGKFDTSKPITLNGMNDGPFSRLIGVHGNQNFKIEYGPDAYIESVNQPISVAPSLYDHQLKKRMHQILK
mgnify:FL=1